MLHDLTIARDSQLLAAPEDNSRLGDFGVHVRLVSLS